MRGSRTIGALSLLAVIIALPPTPAGGPGVRDVIIDQSSVLQRFEPPLRRPPTLGITLGEDVAGVPAAELARVRFTLRAVDLEGVESLDPALFGSLYSRAARPRDLAPRPQVGADGIERIYRDNDYFAAAAVPQQDFASGRVRIIVYESYIRDVVLEGDIEGVRNLRERLQPYIDKMVEMRPVRVSKIIRYALLMTDLAGLTINAEFSKILDDPGAGLLVLTIDFTPRSYRVRLDNFASRRRPAGARGQCPFQQCLRLLRMDRRPRRHQPGRSGGARRRQARRSTCRSDRRGFAVGLRLRPHLVQSRPTGGRPLHPCGDQPDQPLPELRDHPRHRAQPDRHGDALRQGHSGRCRWQPGGAPAQALDQRRRHL